MKISVIHNTYSKNVYIRESAILTIKALEDAEVDYQYIIFNDHGDISIREDIEDLLTERVEYVYSDHNYGMGVCSGGWVGALPFVKGDYIHNIGQDDAFTATFYKRLLSKLADPDVYLAYANGFVVNSSLIATGQLMGPMQELDYSDPKRVFDAWFQRQGNILTAANNYIPAPGVVYKKKVHDIIGIPDLENFKGSADFEYWARVLFNGLKVSYEPSPLWLYRMSEYSHGTMPVAKQEVPKWNDLILKKYQQCLMQSLQEEQVS